MPAMWILTAVRRALPAAGKCRWSAGFPRNLAVLRRGSHERLRNEGSDGIQ